MRLRDRILNECLADPVELTPAERTQVEADPGLTVLLAENSALRDVAMSCPPAPPWENLQPRVYEHVHASEVTTMNILTGFSGDKRRSLQLALGLLAVVVVSAAILFIPNQANRAWATTNGYVLAFDLPVNDYVAGADCRCEDAATCDHKYMGDASRVIQQWSEDNKVGINFLPRQIDGAYTHAVSLMTTFSSMTDDAGAESGSYKLEVTLTGFSPAEFHTLLALIEANDVLPTPRVDDATWYHLEQMQPDPGYQFNIGGHVFYFASYARAAEIEAELNAWVRTQDPGAEPNIEVSIKPSLLGGKQINVKLNGALDGIAE